VQQGNTAGPFDGGDDVQQEFVNTASGGCSEVSIATRSRSETGAATVLGLTRTAVNCCRRTRHGQGFLYFRRSADCVDNPGGRVTTYRQVKGSQSLLRAAAITLR
jgi:hypothetical protein